MRHLTLLALLLLGPAVPAADQPAVLRARPPEFGGVAEWVNSKPLTWDRLRGHVVVVHFWTFG